VTIGSSACRPRFDLPWDDLKRMIELRILFFEAPAVTNGVYGRAAKGGGTFMSREGAGLSARERTRQQRKQRKREGSLSNRDAASARDMETSERLAALCDITWRRKHGQRPDPLRKAAEPLFDTDAACVARVVARLDPIAQRWRALAIGEAISFEWPRYE
jgi:hypothetical protein